MVTVLPLACAVAALATLVGSCDFGGSPLVWAIEGLWLGSMLEALVAKASSFGSMETGIPVAGALVGEVEESILPALIASRAKSSAMELAVAPEASA